MEMDLYEEFIFNMKLAIRSAQDRKWLGEQRHGYCFTCNQEKLVFDVIAKNSPIQPPKCEDCFMDGAIAFLENPDADEKIKELLDNGIEGLE